MEIINSKQNSKEFVSSKHKQINKGQLYSSKFSDSIKL